MVETMTATSTTVLSQRLPVDSSAMNDIVSGPPITDADSAHEQRGEEQSAAKAGAERDDRGQRLQNEDAGNDLQRHRDQAGKMQCAMPRRHHLRRQQRE